MGAADIRRSPVRAGNTAIDGSTPSAVSATRHPSLTSADGAYLFSESFGRLTRIDDRYRSTSTMRRSAARRPLPPAPCRSRSPATTPRPISPTRARSSWVRSPREPARIDPFADADRRRDAGERRGDDEAPQYTADAVEVTPDGRPVQLLRRRRRGIRYASGRPPRAAGPDRGRSDGCGIEPGAAGGGMGARRRHPAAGVAGGGDDPAVLDPTARLRSPSRSGGKNVYIADDVGMLRVPVSRRRRPARPGWPGPP